MNKTIVVAKLKMGKQVTSEAQFKVTLKSVADTLYVIGRKWKLRIVVALTKATEGLMKCNDSLTTSLQNCFQQN